METKQITIKGGLYYDTDLVCDSLGWGRWSVKPYFDAEQLEGSPYIPVRAVEVTFEVPADFDPRSAQIKELENKRQRARAAFQATMTEIERQISQLQAIECDEAAK